METLRYRKTYHVSPRSNFGLFLKSQNKFNINDGVSPKS